MPTDYREFAKKVKNKYPQYKNVDDLELAQKMVEKFPEYKSKVTFDEVKKKESTSKDMGLSSKPQGIESSSVIKPKKEQKPSGSSTSEKITKQIFTSGKPKQEVFTGYPGKEDKRYKLDTSTGLPVWKEEVLSQKVVNGKKSLEFQDKPITNPARVVSLNKQFNKNASTDINDNVFTGYPGKELNEYKIENNTWKRRLPGQTKWVDLNQKSVIDALNNQFKKDVKYSPSKAKFDLLTEDENAESKRDLDGKLTLINSKLIGGEEENAVKKLKEQFPLFKFVEQGMLTDEILVIAPNDKQIKISLDNWTHDDDLNQSSSLREFIKANSASSLNTKEEKMLEAQRYEDQFKIKPVDVKIKLGEGVGDGQELMNLTGSDTSIPVPEKDIMTANIDAKLARSEYFKERKETFQEINDKHRQAIKTTGGIDNKDVRNAYANLNNDTTIAKSLGSYMNDIADKNKSINKEYESLKEYSDQIKDKVAAGEISEEDFKNIYVPKIEQDIANIEKRSSLLNDDVITATANENSINKSIAENLIINSSKGSVGGGISNNLVTGLTDILRIGAGIAGAKSEDTKALQKELVQQIVGSGTTEEYMASEDRSALTKTLFSLSKSMGQLATGSVAGKLAAGVGAGASAVNLASTVPFYAGGYYEMRDQFEGPEFADVSDAEKVLMSTLYGTASGILEKYGLTKSLSKTPMGKGLTNTIIKAAFKDIPKNASAKMIEVSIENSIKKQLVARGANTVGAYIVEASTEAAQELAQVGLQEAFEVVKDNNYFDNGTGWDIASRAWEAAYLGGLGGAVMGTVSQSYGMFKDREKINNIDSVELMRLTYNDANMRDLMLTNIKTKIINKEITPKEGKDMFDAVKNTAAILDKLPDNLSDEQTLNSVNLLVERSNIEKEIAGKDENLVATQKARVVEINNELKNISENATKESNIQEVTAEGGVREYQGVGKGQQEVGVGEGIQRDTTVDEADLGDRNIPSQVQQEKIDAKQAEVDSLWDEKSILQAELEDQGLTEEEVMANPDFRSKVDKFDIAWSELLDMQKPIIEVAPAAEQTEATTEQPTQQKEVTAKQVINRPSTLSEFGGIKFDTPLQGDTYIEGQQVVFEDRATGRVYELGNVDEVMDSPVAGLNAQPETVSVTNEGKISVDGSEWNIQAELPTMGIEYNPAGEVQRVSLKDDNGNTTMFDGQKAVDIAYQIELQKIQSPEQQQLINDLLEQDEEFKSATADIKLAEAPVIIQEEATTDTQQAAQQAEVEVIQPTQEAKEIKSVQEEVDKLRELLGEKPKFKKELDKEEKVSKTDVDSVVEEMNSMPEDIANFDVPSDLTTKNKTNINSLIKRFGDKLKLAFKGGIIKDISEYNGIPMIFTISDQLSSGSIKNEFTGNTIDVNGGIGFNLTEGNENNAWANTDKKEAEGMLLRAQDLYSKNKDLFDRLWSEGKLPKGQIPMAIVKMGQDSIATNEALFRFASDTIKRKFNKLERTNSLNGLIEDISAVNPESKVISFIKENNFKTIDELLDNMNRLKPIGERTNVTRFLFTGGILLNTETKPGKPRSKSALALVGDKDSSYYKYIHLQTINNIIEDQSTKYIPSSHIIGITGIDVLNPQITNPKHRNYPYGVKGGLIGILESPVHAADIFPEMYSKSFYLNKENKAGKLPSPKKAVGESVAASGPVAGIKAFRGAKISTKMTEIQKLLGKLRLAFPTVTVVDTQEEFDKTLESKDVKKFVKDGEVVYGFTKDGKIFLNPKKANSNTAIHEFSHIWMGFLKENNPKLLEKAYDLLKGTEILKRKIAEFGDVELAREEALAELIANKGETLIEAGKKSKFKNWLNAVFSYVKSNFKAFDKLTAEEFQNISLNEFVDGSLASLLGGKEITSKEIKNIKVLFSKGKPKDIEDIIKIAKDNDLSDAAIREYLKQQGYTDKQSTAYINEYNIKSEGIFVTKEGGVPTKITNSIRSLRRRMFSARAFLAKSIFAEKENKDAFIAMHLNIVDQVVKDFNRLYKNYKGDKDALVNDFDAYIRGDKDIELPDGFTEVANSMRNQIDGLSNQLISSGLVDVYMAKTIKDNLGQYLTRSYEIFDNKNWKGKVEAEVRQKAINFLRGQYRTMAEDMAIKENMPVEDALNNLVNNRLDEMLTKDSASNFVSGAKLGSKDLSVLKMREDIPVEIRMLMGEYSDPGLNYAKTILKLSSLAANHKFLSEIKQKGMGVYFFEKNDPRRPIQFNTEIATEGSESMKPLNGLYTTKEMAEAFMAQSKQLNDFFKYIMKVQSALRYSKTILSGATHFKNVIGNLGFVWINGHVDPKELLQSYSIIRNDLKKRNIKQKRDKMNEYIRLGIVKQSAGFGEIMDMFKAADWDTAMASRLSNKKLNLLQKSKKFLLQGKKKVEDYYQAEDDFFKIVAYENELSRYSEALFNKPKGELTDDELKQVNDVVVEIVKNTYPTYDRIPEAIKMIRRSPLIGNFVSFQAESYRTAFNTIALAKSEIASKNPKIKVIGAKRIVGATTYLAAKSAIISLYSSAAGAGLTGLFGYLFDDEDEEEKDKDVRKFVAPWSKMSDLVMLFSKPGTLKYIDFSASDPHGGMKKVMNAFFQGEGTLDSFKSAMLETINPFIGEDMAVEAALSLKNNQDKYGNPIYNTEETFNDQLKKVSSYLYKIIEPGTISSIRRGLEAESKSKELIANLTGYRIYEVDINKQFGYSMNNYSTRIADAKKIYNSAYRNEKLTDAQKTEAYNKANKAVKKIYLEIADLYNSAERLGTKPEDLKMNMKEFGNMSAKTISEIQSRKIEPLKKKEEEEEGVASREVAGPRSGSRSGTRARARY